MTTDTPSRSPICIGKRSKKLRGVEVISETSSFATEQRDPGENPQDKRNQAVAAEQDRGPAVVTESSQANRFLLALKESPHSNTSIAALCLEDELVFSI
jgi:hypothetical protein